MNIPNPEQRDDLYAALTEADALDQFQAIPLEEQERFSAWIAKSQTDTAYWRRIGILVMAIRLAPRITPPAEPRAMP